MARLVALGCLAVRVYAAESAFGRVTNAECPSGTAFAWFSQTFGVGGTTAEGWSTLCPPGLDTCLSGGAGQALTLSGGNMYSVNGFARPGPRWRSSIDLAVTWSAAANAQIGLSFSSMTEQPKADSKFTQIGAGSVSAHTLAPDVTLRSGDVFNIEKDAQVSGRATKAKGPGYYDPSSPDLRGSVLANWTLSLRPMSLRIGFEPLYDALVLTRSDSAPWVDPAEELVRHLRASRSDRSEGSARRRTDHARRPEERSGRLDPADRRLGLSGRRRSS